MTTIETVNTQSPELLMNEVDKRVVKIRPMSTPLDQISRWAGARHAGSMIVDYYSVDTKPMSATFKKTAVPEDSDENSEYVCAALKTDNNRIFQPTDTILVPAVDTVDRDGSKSDSLILYVYGISESTGDVMVIPVNNYSDGKYRLPDINSGTKLIRMGRAATELDVQTPQFESVPVKTSNNCQIFKAQIEQSTFFKLANKEVGWDFNDQEEAAVIDMRLGMEKTFLFGTKCRFTDPVKHDEVLLTGGIWNQTPNTWEYDENGLSTDSVISMMRQAFTENAGSSRKILIGGSGFIHQLHNNIDVTRVVSSQETVTKWGIDFTEMRSKFGSLYVLMSEVFDQCGHADDAMIIDPEYITKYCHVPFHTEKLDLRTSGVRNTEAIVLTEASCLVLRYPNAHMKVVKKKAAQNN